MKRATLAISMVALMGLTACAGNGGTWTPMSEGRTAGNMAVEASAPSMHKADKTFSQEMHK